jgi:hypothetical protein
LSVYHLQQGGLSQLAPDLAWRRPASLARAAAAEFLSGAECLDDISSSIAWQSVGGSPWQASDCCSARAVLCLAKTRSAAAHDQPLDDLDVLADERRRRSPEVHDAFGSGAANMPEVQPGMALTAVQGSGLMGLSYAEILDRIKIAGRPLSLSFTQSEPVAEPEPERGWLLPKCQASCACCSAVLPLSKPRARDHGTQWAHHQLTDSCAQLRCCYPRGYPRGCRPRSELTQLWRATRRTSPPSELALCKYKIRLY